MVFWRPRATLKKYFKQLFGYTRSDGHGKLWFRRQIIRYTSYFVGLVLLYLTFTKSWVFILVLLLGMLDYMRRFWLRWLVFSEKLSSAHKILGFIILPAIVAFGDVAKLCGWPVGVYERRSGKIKFEKF